MGRIWTDGKQEQEWMTGYSSSWKQPLQGRRVGVYGQFCDHQWSITSGEEGAEGRKLLKAVEGTDCQNKKLLNSSSGTPEGVGKGKQHSQS